MYSGHLRRFFVVLLLVAMTSTTFAESQLGKTVDDFQLKSHLGREWSLGDFDDKKVIVIAFLGTECPLVKLYGPRLTEMRDKFAEQGVEFLGINSNTQDSMTEMTAFVDRYGISFPMLKDLGNEVADALQAERTPEVFVLDADRKIRYHGRIDDQYGVGYLRDKADRHDLDEAISELLAGEEVSLPETKPIGCHIGRVSKVNPTGDVTFSNQIARIFNKRCVECHREGQLAPFTLSNYQDVLGWEDTILEVIADNRMPPWFANPEHGTFKNDARLSEEEKELIRTWVENGMPEGDPANLPEPVAFAEGWRIPKPDQVFYMRDEAFEVPAQGTVDYKHFMVDPKWDEDKYIYAAEARPDNTSVVHHILVYVLPPDGRRDPDLRTVLVGYAPGSTPKLLENGTAMKVPAGSKLLFQMHYTPNGHVQEDRSYAGVCFIDEDQVTKLIDGRLAIKTDFAIPPETSDYIVKADYRARRDEMLVSMTPHMHLRGAAFRYEAIYPNGDREVLLDVPNYDFNWQLKYTLAEPKLLPKGTKIHCTAKFDNSEDNIVNPDPSETVRWGDQSWEEMMIGFFDTVPVDRPDETLKSTNVEIDPTGVWTWERRALGRTMEESLTIKLEGDQLKGTIVSDGNEIPIEDAVMDGKQLKFSVTMPQRRGIILDFDARVEEDELEGKIRIAVESFGREWTSPWKATRTK